MKPNSPSPVSSLHSPVASLFPHSVAAAEITFANEDIDCFPEEAREVMHAVPKRRREFAAGRLCARASFAELGHPAVAVLRDTDRAPVWPPTLVGSITHCEGFAAAAAALARDYRSLGIDVEQERAVSSSLNPVLLRPDEVKHLSALPPGMLDWRTVFFSAKEAVYKTVFPLVREFLDPHDIRIHVDADSQQFEALILVGRMKSARIPGRFAHRQSRIHTASWLLR